MPKNNSTCLGRILNGNPPEDVRSELIEGAVGAGFAAEFEAFVNIYTKLPSLDELIKILQILLFLNSQICFTHYVA